MLPCHLQDLLLGAGRIMCRAVWVIDVKTELLTLNIQTLKTQDARKVISWGGCKIGWVRTWESDWESM